MMPGMDGYETCRRIREDPATSFIPVVMVTASGTQEKVRAIEAGADDFVTKPLNQAELLARVRSLVRVKRYHDTVVAQAAALAEWNRQLEERVADAGRRARPARPAPPVPVAADRPAHRRHGRRVLPREPPPRDRLGVHRPAGLHRRSPRAASRRRPWRCWREYHLALGELVFAYEGTLEHFAGDGLLVFFNDPVPCPDAPDSRGADGSGHARRGSPSSRRGGAARATTSASVSASRRATPRSAGSGSPAATTTPRSARSPTSPPGCAPWRRPDQILVSQRVRHGIVGPVDCREVGPLELKGFSRPVEAHEVIALH